MQSVLFTTQRTNGPNMTNYLSCFFLALCIGVSFGVDHYTLSSEFYEVLAEARDGGETVQPRITGYSDGHYSISVTTSKGTRQLKNLDKSTVDLFAKLFTDPNIVITRDSQSGSNVQISVTEQSEQFSSFSNGFSFAGGAKEFTVTSEFFNLINEARASGVDLQPKITAHSDGTYSITVTTSKGTRTLRNLSQELIQLFAQLFTDRNLNVSVVSRSGSNVKISVSDKSASSQTSSTKEFVGQRTSYSARCSTECITKGQKYYWCHTDKAKYGFSWDYCTSTGTTGKTSLGRDCKANHACAKYTEKFDWCYTTTGKWDYCVSDGSKSTFVGQKTSRSARCESECFQQTEKFYWCFTEKAKYGFKWDYCTSTGTTGKTSLGRDCKANHACAKRTEKFNWCYTTTGKWDYCVPN